MLEQRRAKDKGYITLREAAEISSYAPDYIGQLIRSGKIRGEQVYSNVAWVTTEEEILAYMNDKSRTVTDTDLETIDEDLPERAANYVLYLIIACLVMAILLLQYIFYVALDEKLDASYLVATNEEVS